MRAILLGLMLLPSPTFAHLALDEQIAALTVQIESHPMDAALLLRRGDLHRAGGNWRQARADYRRARGIGSTPEIADLHLGMLDLAEGEPRRARAAFDRYLTVRPGDPAGLRARARAFRDLGQPLRAAEDLRRVIASFEPPRRPEPDDYLERARALEAAGDGHLVEAIAVLDEGVRTLGPIVSLELPAIDFDLKSGRLEEALRRLDLLESRSERPGIWAARRTEILERAGVRGGL